MNETNLNPPAPELKDRRTGLVVFGVLEILLGAGCVLMVGLIILGQMMSAQMTAGTTNLRLILPAGATYGMLAVALVWLGIGSIKCRRWARALLLISSWSGLVVGGMTGVAMVFMLPRMLAAQPAGSQPLPPEARVAIAVVSLLMVAVLFVAIPGAMTLFYQSRHVKATCEARDPLPRWTDACPLPVLGVTCWLWLGGVTLLLMPFGYGGVLPAFGILVSGPPAWVAFFVLAALWLWLGWMFYRLKPAGWWILVVLLALFLVSSVLTYTRVDLAEMYRLMNFSEEQIEQIRAQGWVTGNFFLWWTLAAMLPIFGYLLWVKRYFRALRP